MAMSKCVAGSQSFAEFKAAIAEARAGAVKEAKDCTPFIRSRGTFIATLNPQGQCLPCPEAQALTWNGTKKELERLVARVQKDYPSVTEVYVAGGYDGFETMADMMARDADYDPWISSWNVTYWKREE